MHITDSERSVVAVSGRPAVHEWDITPEGCYAVQALVLGEAEKSALGRFLRRDGDRAVLVRVLKMLLP